MVDISKCMSQNNDVEMEEAPKFEVPPENKVVEEVVEKAAEVEVEEEKEKDLKEKEKMEVESVLERRQSQNSETNNEGQENTPIQTDNDEVGFWFFCHFGNCSW